jgi:hypothetical protein
VIPYGFTFEDCRRNFSPLGGRIPNVSRSGCCHIEVERSNRICRLIPWTGPPRSGLMPQGSCCTELCTEV